MNSVTKMKYKYRVCSKFTVQEHDKFGKTDLNNQQVEHVQVTTAMQPQCPLLALPKSSTLYTEYCIMKMPKFLVVDCMGMIVQQIVVIVVGISPS